MKYNGNYATGSMKCLECGGLVRPIIKAKNEEMVGKMICHNCNEVYQVRPIKVKSKTACAEV